MPPQGMNNIPLLLGGPVSAPPVLTATSAGGNRFSYNLFSSNRFSSLVTASCLLKPPLFSYNRFSSLITAASPGTCLWEEFTSPDGFKYYHNSATQQVGGTNAISFRLLTFRSIRLFILHLRTCILLSPIPY